ncbi:MAG: hypothetical protein QM722_24010 [Piscinibacter sp.]
MSSRKPAKEASDSRAGSWVRDLLKRPLKLERRDGQIHVVLGDKPPAPPAPPSSGEALRLGHAELRELLRRHPEARHLMRHLGYVEQMIGRFGSRALKREIPVPVLAKALQQLDVLARDEPSAALADLRARIAAAVDARPPVEAPDAETETRPGSLEVTEASHSLFDEMERSWTGQIPLPDGKPVGRG